MPAAVSITKPPISRPLSAVLAATVIAAVAVPALVVTLGPRARPSPRLLARHARVIPPAELPPVEPVRFEALTPDDARTINAAVPFVALPNPAARPFRLPGAEADRARATDCLAAAVLYEAGDDAVGERAVAQVVLNRTRHPAYPKTVCGVVFQGSERSTGCQFTFSCDGALARVPDEAALARARAIATAALAGAVYKPVGWATHYHTDWVVPYWQSSLDKIAAVHTHLFYRWTGWWGTPPAFDRQVQAEEPVVPKLAFLSAAHRIGALGTADGSALLDPAAGANPDARPVIESSDAFLIAIDRSATPAAMTAVVAQLCGERPYCKLLGWSDAAKRPTALPLSAEQMAAMSFSYLRDRGAGFEKMLWNCADFPSVEAKSCMRRLTPPARGAEGIRPDVAVGMTAPPVAAKPASAVPLADSRPRGAAAAPVPLPSPSGNSTAAPPRAP